MISAPPISDTPGPTPVLAESHTVESHTVESLRDRWARHEARVRELRREESSAAAAVAADLQKHTGYYAAAVARNKELLLKHSSRPDLRWAMVRWAEIFDTEGFPLVLRMLTHPEEHQELLSSSPFYLMLPPRPENDFYQAYVSSPARHC